jgi:hypothetical protein
MLFEEPAKFKGLPVAGFDTFAIQDSERRRRAIIETIHPALSALGEDLLEALSPRAAEPLHAHLPRLDWPPDYQPFCTWLALSREKQGYQSGPQLSLGVHADHVTARMGWDTSSDLFGRFEFLCRHGDLGGHLLELAAEEGLLFRVYAAAVWPEGSRCVFESPYDLPLSFEEARKRGVWWEVGRRYGLPGAMALVSSAGFGQEVAAVFMAMLPLYDRIIGDRRIEDRE